MGFPRRPPNLDRTKRAESRREQAVKPAPDRSRADSDASVTVPSSPATGMGHLSVLHVKAFGVVQAVDDHLCLPGGGGSIMPAQSIKCCPWAEKAMQESDARKTFKLKGALFRVGQAVLWGTRT